MKKVLSILVSIVCVTGLFVGCGASANDSISVISREDGSGTRSAFIELFSIEVKNEDGSKKDTTTKEAIIINKTDVMLTNVSSDENAVGYVSLGSLNNSVKALEIDGVKASSEAVKSGEYKIARTFNIAVKGEATGLTKDFIDFILSKDGQNVVAKSYIAINDNAEAYSGNKPSGKIIIAGSSSVTPIMEKLKESYEKINTDATIEIQQLDSTAGMTGAMEGTFDIGMASRDLKDSEKEQLTGIGIAIDGIAVIVNNKNTVNGLTNEQVKNIFTGEIAKWSEAQK